MTLPLDPETASLLAAEVKSYFLVLLLLCHLISQLFRTKLQRWGRMGTMCMGDLICTSDWVIQGAGQ